MFLLGHQALPVGPPTVLNLAPLCGRHHRERSHAVRHRRWSGTAQKCEFLELTAGIKATPTKPNRDVNS